MKSNNFPVFKFLKERDCCGCEACVTSCRFDAISMIRHEDGFYYPLFCEDKCRRCNKCITACPQISNKSVTVVNRSYAGYSSDEELVKNSSSGGFFGLISEELINKEHFVVYGVRWADDFSYAYHSKVEQASDIPALRKSKYIQSRKNNVYLDVIDDLNHNKKVLFVGTPCEVAALDLLVNDSQKSNLFTIDFVCQGPTTEVAWQQFKQSLEKRKRGKTVFVDMRFSIGIWIPQFLKVVFDNKREYIDRLYETAFGDSVRFYQREACFDCKYHLEKRVSDITLGDFHGVNKESSYFNESGTSIAISHTKKGDYLISLLEGKAVCLPVDYNELVKHNPCLNIHWPKKEEYNAYRDFFHAKGVFGTSKLIIPFKRRLLRLLDYKKREKLFSLKRNNKE